MSLENGFCYIKVAGEDFKNTSKFLFITLSMREAIYSKSTRHILTTFIICTYYLVDK